MIRDAAFWDSLTIQIIDDHFYGDLTVPVLVLEVTSARKFWKEDRMQMAFFPSSSHIEIMPHLCDERVPLWLGKYVLFHEVIHAFLWKHHEYRGHMGAFAWIIQNHPDHERAEHFLSSSKLLQKVEEETYGKKV